MITQLLDELIETVVADVKNPPIKIYGVEWGEPPSDSEWCFDSEEESDEFEQQQNWWGESLTIIRANYEDESEDYDDGDVAEYWNERQYDCR